MQTIFTDSLQELANSLVDLPKEYLLPAQRCIRVTAEAIQNSGTLFFCGNGGSAATASHISNDLACHMKNWKRGGYACVCLNDSPSVLTSLTNDYGFEQVFAKPLTALAKEGDVIWGFSTSGNSKNVVKAFEAAHSCGVRTVAFTGRGGGTLKSCSDIWIPVNSDEVVRVEELHLIYAHAIAVSVEAIVSPLEADLA